MTYLALPLSQAQHDLVVAKWQPKFSNVRAHHITLGGERVNTLTKQYFDAAKSVAIIGYASNEFIEALLVTVNGTQFRQDGKRYHITLSFCDGHKPVESNDLLKTESNITYITPIELGEIKPELL